jgi:hypothetical protein
MFSTSSVSLTREDIVLPPGFLAQIHMVGVFLVKYEQKKILAAHRHICAFYGPFKFTLKTMYFKWA